MASCVVLGLCISRSPRHSVQTHATVSVLHILKVIESSSFVFRQVSVNRITHSSATAFVFPAVLLDGSFM